jgi:hypothetical protein
MSTVPVNLGAYTEVTATVTSRAPVLCNVLALVVPPPMVQNLMKHLAVHVPAPELRHFKRATKREAVLAGSVMESPSPQEEGRTSGTSPALVVLLGPVGTLPDDAVPPAFHSCAQVTVQLPLDPPETVEEWHVWSRLWPLSLPLPRPRPTVRLSAAESVVVWDMVHRATQLAVQGWRHGYLARAAIVFQADTGIVLAATHDRRSRPLLPASEVATAAAAAAAASVAGVTRSECSCQDATWPPYWHSALAVIDHVAREHLRLYFPVSPLEAAQRLREQSLQSLHASATDTPEVGTKRGEPAAGVGPDDAEPESEELPLPYLCSNCDIFLTHEPCIGYGIAMLPVPTSLACMCALILILFLFDPPPLDITHFCCCEKTDVLWL